MERVQRLKSSLQPKDMARDAKDIRGDGTEGPGRKNARPATILGKQIFKSEFSSQSLTKVCKKEFGEVNGETVSVIDTPGFFDTNTDQEETSKEIVRCMNYASSGPHVFLVLIQLGRFTEEEKNTVLKIQKLFGADRYSMVLFTHGYLLKGKPIEEFLKDNEDLKELLAKCNGNYHVFYTEAEDQTQVIELLDKIRNMVRENGGSHYTTEMFQMAEKAIEEEKQRIREEKEEQMRKNQERLQKKTSHTRKGEEETVAPPVSLLWCPHLQISFPRCLAPKISLLGPFPFRHHLCQYNRPLVVGGCIVFPFNRQNKQMNRSKFIKYNIITNAINYKDFIKTQQSI
ncbi:GTPase IMAP family member 9-like [Clinocottus analis]|uniref:GTPase IMAP family member 9-like n=1 Tax=Clinocottus analis TaxID=304258 RepID=UPI0035C00446